MGRDKVDLSSHFQGRPVSRKYNRDVQIDVYVNKSFKNHASYKSLKQRSQLPFKTPSTQDSSPFSKRTLKWNSTNNSFPAFTSDPDPQLWYQQTENTLHCK